MSTHLLSRRPPLGAAALLLMLLPACSAESLEALDAALGGDGSVDGPCSGADAPSAGCPKDPPPPGAVCGDGAIEAREQCDDGNTHDGDGCNSACALEPGTDPGAVCGDGVIEAREQCDDGNTHDGDGCSSDCTSSTVAFAFSGAVVKLGNGPETGEDPLNTGVQVGDPIRGVYRFNPHNVADHRS
jgi:cysteine-rich repeat protein